MPSELTPPQLLRSTLRPLNFRQQYGLPALKCLAAGCLPYALLRTLVFAHPVFFQIRPNKNQLAFYAVHSWAIFMLIMAGLILFLGLNYERPTRSILKASPPTLS